MVKEGKIQNIKYAPPPPELPVLGRSAPEDTSFIGRTNYVAGLEEKRFIFGLKRIDRRRHLYVIGKSGVGKSKLLELLLRQDIAHGKGICLIDPHGEVIEQILDFIPENRIQDVCLIDPSDVEFPVSFNPLANVDPIFKYQLAQAFIEIMKKQFGANWTPRIEHLFRFTILALLDYPEATMRGMGLIFTNEKYRALVITHIKDDMVKRFWSHEFPEWAQKFDTEAIIPLVNKLGQLLSNPLLRNVFSQHENKIDLESLINGGKIILINLSKGKLGEENSSFFGSMFIAKIKQAGMARVSIPDWARSDFYLYIDEFQNLVTETFENILSESKKYGVCLTMSHQYLSQLTEHVQAAVLGSIGSLIVFRVGGEDAARLENEMTPVFKAKDMINLGVQEFYVKMTIDGETYDPFSADTLKVLPSPHRSFRDEIIASSRSKFSVSLKIAEQIIFEEDSLIHS